MRTAAVLLGLAAVGGVIMTAIRLGGAIRPPSWIAMAHGLLAAAALTLLIYSAATVGLSDAANAAIGLLVLAALGGVSINLLYHDKMRPLPVPLVMVHALLAVAGFVMLMVAILGTPTA